MTARSAKRWASELVEMLSDEERALLGDDPVHGIEQVVGVIPQPTESLPPRGAHGACDGFSNFDAGIIRYVPTAGYRDRFTLLHEVGHWLIEQDDDLINWLGEQDDEARLIEQICDFVAADLLLPDALLDGFLDGAPPTAEHIPALVDLAKASRHVCAIGLVSRISCASFAVIVDPETMRIIGAARGHDCRPYGWAGNLVPAGSPLRVAAPGASRALQSSWPYPNGTSRDLYLSLHHDGRYVYGIFAENNLWGVAGLTISSVDDSRRFDGEVTCPCGYSGPTSNYPCSVCGQSPCPRCQECSCHRRARIESRGRCAGCSTVVREHLLEDGLCDMCR